MLEEEVANKDETIQKRAADHEHIKSLQKSLSHLNNILKCLSDRELPYYSQNLTPVSPRNVANHFGSSISAGRSIRAHNIREYPTHSTSAS